jgi:hypothetical protein
MQKTSNILIRTGYIWRFMCHFGYIWSLPYFLLLFVLPLHISASLIVFVYFLTLSSQESAQIQTNHRYLILTLQ